MNVAGLVSSLMLFYVALSKEAWWSLAGGAGDETFSALVSPFYVQLMILGRPVDVPVIPYLNLSAQLVMVLTAALLLLGSLFPSKGWAGLMYGHRALGMALLFIVGLYVGLKLAEGYAGVTVPLMGAGILRYTITQAEMAISTETPIVASFTAQYWIALLASILASAAKVLHIRRKAAAEGGN